jgi:hypothetical protein
MSLKGKWGYSTDGESYSGVFDTKQEATDELNGEAGWIGQYRDPISPEMCVDGHNLIEQVLCHDDYDNEWMNGLKYAPKQLEELTQAVRSTFGSWLDKYKLRPTFGLIENAERIN